MRMTRMVLTVLLVAGAVCGCATVAGGLIGTGVGIATGHPISGALIGTGVGLAIDTAPSQDRAPTVNAPASTR